MHAQEEDDDDGRRKNFWREKVRAAADTAVLYVLICIDTAVFCGHFDLHLCYRWMATPFYPTV